MLKHDTTEVRGSLPVPFIEVRTLPQIEEQVCPVLCCICLRGTTEGVVLKLNILTMVFEEKN